MKRSTTADVMRANLLAVAYAYADARNAALSSVSTYVRGNTYYFTRIENGEGKMIAEVFDHCMNWFTDNWPPDAPWPDGVPRPDPAPATTRKSA